MWPSRVIWNLADRAVVTYIRRVVSSMISKATIIPAEALTALIAGEA